VGTAINNQFDNLLLGAARLFLSDPQSTTEAAQSALVEGTGGGESSSGGSSSGGSSETSSLLQSNLRRAVTIVHYASSICIVFLFGLVRGQTFISENHRDLSREDYILLVSLLTFPVLIILFYVRGGLSTVLSRTYYIGIYFVIFAFVSLLYCSRPQVRTIVKIFAAVAILSGLLVLGVSSALQNPVGIDKEYGVTFTGEYTSGDEFVFGDGQTTPQLLYYNNQGVTLVHSANPDWEGNMEAIYFSERNPEAAVSAVQDSIVAAQIKDSSPPESAYLLLNEGVAQTGVPMLSSVTRPTETDPTVKFEQSLRTSKLYTNGKVELFHADLTDGGENISASAG
jgi:hypothetical protein